MGSLEARAQFREAIRWMPTAKLVILARWRNHRAKQGGLGHDGLVQLALIRLELIARGRELAV